ncbi:energy transducer TonB [uncultured Algimonas sp.]|uniref:energy transducer TonB n=1 Tax=uncultured Algimonas sp. TaxID=1547920 RepID=UPI00261C908C|nr:energy transducer TonB [uncultured Algimonas sp.]
MTSIKKTCAAFALALCLASPSAAQLPDSVKTSYDAYVAAMKSGDADAVKTSARAAWQAAESTLGDHKSTGDLAFNYAAAQGKPIEKDQIEAVERSMELTDGYGADAPLTYLERGIVHIQLLRHRDKIRRARHAAIKLVDYADENGLSGSTFTGEALTLLAGMHASEGDGERAAEASERALTIFESATDGIRTVQHIHANLYRGYAHESDEDHMSAALRYQTVMEKTDGFDPGTYPVVGTALGRWIHMRGALRDAGRLEEAEEKGLCQCWPYDKPRNENVLPIKRIPPVMPTEARQSGYVVVEFDLTDEGRPTNERVITAWPEYFEKPAMRSLGKWEYSARTPDQTDADRTDILATITFRLLDERGDVIW